MPTTTEIHPPATVFRVEDQGLRGPCAARNAGLRSARAPWVFLLDEDAEPAPDCLERLLAEAALHPDAAIISPRVLLCGEPAVIHYDGGRCHFLAEASFDHFHRPLSEARECGRRPDVVATTALLIRRDAALDWGLFDEGMVFFREDLEFCLRARLLGARIRHCPEAVVRHRQGARGPLHARRVFYQARNRWWTMIKIYQPRTLVLTFPLQAVFEALSLCRSAIEGKMLEHLSALADVARHLPELLRARRALQARRRVADRDLLSAPAPTWRPGTLAMPGAAFAGRVLGFACEAWWRWISRPA